MNMNSSAIRMIQRIPERYPFKFLMIADTYTAHSPDAEIRFAQLCSQMKQIDPQPLFMIHLGDFAYPGTIERHRVYEQLISELGIPTVSVIGNHELDVPNGLENYHNFIGEENFYFDYENTRFIGIYSAYEEHLKPGRYAGGPRAQDLEFLKNRLESSNQVNKIVLTHVPPDLDGHYSQYLLGAGTFKDNEEEFLKLVEKYKVKMVGCAHILAFDRFIHKGINYIVTGGGGADLKESKKNIFHHFVLFTVYKTGQIGGEVIKINNGIIPEHDYDFTIT